MENKENEHLIFREFPIGNIVLKERTHSINNKIKLYMNKLGNYLLSL